VEGLVGGLLRAEEGLSGGEVTALIAIISINGECEGQR
jgi:hypothetical protein